MSSASLKEVTVPVPPHVAKRGSVCGVSPTKNTNPINTHTEPNATIMEVTEEFMSTVSSTHTEETSFPHCITRAELRGDRINL